MINGRFTMAYQVPHKAILSPEQLAFFQSSQTHQDILSYIEVLNASVIGVKLSDACSESQVSLLSICMMNYCKFLFRRVWKPRWVSYAESKKLPVAFQPWRTLH